MRLDGKEVLRTEDICLTFHPEDGIPVTAADHVSSPSMKGRPSVSSVNPEAESQPLPAS